MSCMRCGKHHSMSPVCTCEKVPAERIVVLKQNGNFNGYGSMRDNGVVLAVAGFGEAIEVVIRHHKTAHERQLEALDKILSNLGLSKQLSLAHRHDIIDALEEAAREKP